MKLTRSQFTISTTEHLHQNLTSCDLVDAIFPVFKQAMFICATILVSFLNRVPCLMETICIEQKMKQCCPNVTYHQFSLFLDHYNITSVDITGRSYGFLPRKTATFDCFRFFKTEQKLLNVSFVSSHLHKIPIS